MVKNMFEHGSEIIEKLTPGGAEKIILSHGDVAPDLARYIVEFVFGEVYSRDGLDLKTKQLLTICVLSTIGFAKPQLAYHMKAAINIGIKPKEIIDLITHITPYVGFPTALTALNTAKEVFKDTNTEGTNEKKKY